MNQLDPEKFLKDYLPAQRVALNPKATAAQIMAKIEDQDKLCKLDFNTYGDVLFDTLLRGGIVSAGNEMSTDPEELCEACVLKSKPDEIARYVELTTQLIQRRPYLRAKLEESLNKLSLFVEHYTESEFNNLASFCGQLFGKSSQFPATFTYLLKQTPRLVENNMAIRFCAAYFRFFLRTEPRVDKLMQTLRAAKVDSIAELMPQRDRNPASLIQYLEAHDLKILADYQKQVIQKDLLVEVAGVARELFSADGDRDIPSIVAALMQAKKDRELQDHEMVNVVFDSLVSAIDWSKKVQQHSGQLMTHIQKLGGVLIPFAQNARAQIEFMVHLQLYCHDNINVSKCFLSLVQVFYQLDVISESCIMLWYKGHPRLPTKGRNEFVRQLDPMVKWLQTAEVEDN